MQVYLLRRIVALVLVLLVTSSLVFTLSRLIPGDPARVAAGQDATADMVAQLRQRLGLDQPLPVQYAHYVSRLLQGDLGRSIISQRPVVDELKERLPATLELAGTSLILSTVFGIALGVLAATRRGRWTGLVGRLIPASFISAPTFWVGLILQFVFYGQLGWLPHGGRVATGSTLPRVTGFLTVDAVLAGNWAGLGEVLAHLVLPALVLTNISLAIIARITAASVMEVLAQPYITTARAKGVTERLILARHVARNAAIPTVTVIGMRLGDLMAGAVIVETVFSWPGVGRYAVDAIDHVDYPAMMGFVLFVAAVYATVNLVVDLLYFWLDPRISAVGT